MQTWLALLMMLLGYAACTDSFHESLSVQPLQDGRVDVAFNFTIRDDSVCE